MEVRIEQGWKALLQDEFKKEYFKYIVTWLKTEKLSGRDHLSARPADI